MTKKYEIEENGYTYMVEEVDGQITAKYLKSEPVEEPVSEPTEEEIFKAQSLLNQMEILPNQGAQDEVLAEILLSGLEG